MNNLRGRWMKAPNTWWRHKMETLSALVALCAGSLPVQRSVTRSFDAFFDLRLNKRMSKQSWGWWFETPRAHCDVIVNTSCMFVGIQWKCVSFSNTIHPMNIHRIVLRCFVFGVWYHHLLGLSHFICFFLQDWVTHTHAIMMTPSNGNIFRVTGYLCEEFTGHRWISRTKASEAELWCFLWSAPE